ncbi:hypothetical protein BJX76DRAFT_319770 [Aspergillus varians]
MAGKLWWMSKQDGSNISPLHRQMVKGRMIISTEDPRLHLVWINDRIFVKPLPRYLISHSFWHEFMNDQSKHTGVSRLRKAALGYLRTYYSCTIRVGPSRCTRPSALSGSEVGNLETFKPRRHHRRRGFGPVSI